MLIEVQVDAQVVALRKRKQGIKRAHGIGAGIEACSQELRLELDGALETLHCFPPSEIVGEVENAMTSTSRRPATSSRAASTPCMDRISTIGSTSVCVRSRVTPCAMEHSNNRLARARTSAAMKAARAVAAAASASASEAGRNDCTAKLRSAWACRLTRPGSASQRGAVPAVASIASMRPARRLTLWQPARCGNTTASSRRSPTLNSPAARTPRSRACARAPVRSDISSPAPHRSSAGCAESRAPARHAAA